MRCKAIIATAGAVLGIIYRTLKHGWVFRTSRTFVLADNNTTSEWTTVIEDVLCRVLVAMRQQLADTDSVAAQPPVLSVVGYSGGFE